MLPSLFKKNISIVIVAQVLVLAASIIKSLAIPKVLGVEEFAYWQIYVLYAGFTGVFSLGFSDGIYLLYGGKNYDELPKGSLRALFRINVVILVLFTVIACFASMLIGDGKRAAAFFFVSMDITATCVSGLCLYVLQITNRFKEYGVLVSIDKILMLLAVAGLVLLHVSNSVGYIIADCLTKYIACILLVRACRELYIGPCCSEASKFKEYLAILKVGAGLLFANLAGMLAVNFGRFVIELTGNLSSYAYYSFGISITNLVLTFVTAVSLVIYPSLKRVDLANLPYYFKKISKTSSLVSYVCLLSYTPICGIIYVLFPQYTPLLSYVSFLLLSVSGQVKMQLLCNTYYKAMRLERRLFIANLLGVLAMVGLSIPSFLMTHEAIYVAAATAITMVLRSWMSERELSKCLGIWRWSNIAPELIVFSAFAIGTLMPGYLRFVLPFVTCLIACSISVVCKKKKRGND